MKLILVNTVFILSLFIASASLLAAEEVVVEKSSIDTASELTVKTATEDKNSQYPVSFFSQYTPQNAMDMINRLPGFTFDKGSDERGFGGNAGNVLIDGARPTSKSGGLKEALKRIPASQVMSIEILRSGVSAGEAAGQSIVANVVKKEVNTSGTWGVQTSREQNGDLKTYAKGSISIKLGEWDSSFDTKLGTEPESSETFGAFIEEFDANGILTSTSDEVRDANEDFFALNGEGSRDLAGGKLTLNAAFGRYEWRRDTSRDVFEHTNNNSSANITYPDELWQLDEKKESINTELGIDWVKVFNDWKLRTIALTSSVDSQYAYTEKTDYLTAESREINLYSKDTLATEHILRTTYGKVANTPFKPEFGLEIANNRLESDISSIENDVPEILEGADTVEELRAELFINFMYSVNAALTLDGGVTYEYSNIKAYSDTIQSQTFNFLKPRLSANYTLNKSSTVTLIAEHSVEQLDFSDFASSADSTENRDTSGNDNLQPEQVTSISVVYDWRFSERGSLDMTVYVEDRQDIHEEIFLPSGNAGIGNAGDAKFWGVKTNINLPLDAILENGLLEIEHSYKDSAFYEPMINDYRTIYNYIPHWLKVDFRQDITQYAFSWGFQYRDGFEKTRYYIDETKKLQSNNRLSKLFIETTALLGMKTRLTVKDVNVTRYNFTRLYYQDDRSGNFIGSENVYRKRKPIVELSFSGSF